MRALQSDASLLGLDGTVVPKGWQLTHALSVEAAQHKATQQKTAAEALDPKAKKTERTSGIAQQRDAARSPTQKHGSATEGTEHDPEAVNQPQRRGGYAPSYKPSIVVTKDRVITGQTVHSSNEAVQVPELLV